MNKQCPTCSHRKESFFADGTTCPTCGRRASLFLRDVEHSSGVQSDEIESLKIALRIKTEEHDCCASDLLNFRQDAADIATIAMRKAWQLGQTYWQQADSDYTSHHRKAEATQVMFQALIDSTRNQIMNMEAEDT